MLHLTIDDRAGVRRLTLNRPDVHNAFDDALIAELTEALVDAEKDDAVRAIVLAGAGASFSAGADLRWMRRMAQATEAENLADSLRLATLMRTLMFCVKPTVAAVHGAAFGGGVGLVACCDIAIGATNASFGLSEVKLGLVPAVISPYVIHAIGLRHARRLFLTGETFDAPAALRIGLLHEMVEPDALESAVEATVKRLTKAGPVAQHEAKKLALRMAGLDSYHAERVDRDNAALIARLRISPEGQEGLAAFLDRRAPAWPPHPPSPPRP